ncbi:MAG TPA: ABC transporter ATP-binding protein [Candidatus Norongarragalinales archaeon]|nr:ABC transporter ATP-binding protein [Candidatus Norongarragalinales archaeon]
MATPKVVMKLENVCKVYGEGDVSVKALCDINLEFREGEVAAIMGPSGSGKSTMLHILGLLDRPTQGRLFLDGIETSTLSDDELAGIRGKKIGFVFQFFFLVPSLTVLENVMLPMMLLGIDELERERHARDLLKKVGLEDRMHHLPSELSGGQRQRTAIARALANNPSIIFADEPTGNLDSKTGNEIMQLFDDLHKKDGRTIIFVTHDPSLVEHSERVIQLKDGKIERIIGNGKTMLRKVANIHLKK